MTVVLPKSVFFHIGRTGGHWVNHVLWRAGLIEKRLSPLHLTPAAAASNPLVSAKTEKFCFVRHPLDWAASVWRHEMEFGWSESELSRVAADDNFASFLRKLLGAYPDGPCSHAMTPYLDGCTFVGKLENIAEDLTSALVQAGETFDPKAFAARPVNQSSIPALLDASVAPAALLEEFLQAEAGFCERFGYGGYDPRMVGSAASTPWPRFASRNDSGDAALSLGRTRFTYHLDNGVVVGGGAKEQRLQWGLIKAARALKGAGRTAVVSEIDPYVGHLFATLGEAEVTIVPSDVRVTPRRLNAQIANDIEVCDFRSFHAAGQDRPFDTVVLVDSADISAAFEDELLSTFERLKPAGRLLIVAPILQSDLPVSTTFADSPAASRVRKLIYRSLPDWRTVLANCGFEDFSVVDRFDEAPSEARRKQVEALADALKADPAHLLGKAVISVRRVSESRIQFENRELWLRRRILSLEEAYDSLPKAVEARILVLEAEARAERQRREKAEQGIIDREQELFSARRDLHALAMDADHSRSLSSQALEAQRACQAELDALRAMMSALGVGSEPRDPSSDAGERHRAPAFADRDGASDPYGGDVRIALRVSG